MKPVGSSSPFWEPSALLVYPSLWQQCVFVCLCTRVDLRREILRVKCSPGLNYHFWVLSHHPASRGPAVFLSVFLHTLPIFPGLSHTHTYRDSGGDPDSVSPLKRGVKEESRDWRKMTSSWEHIHFCQVGRISHEIISLRHEALKNSSHQVTLILDTSVKILSYFSGFFIILSKLENLHTFHVHCVSVFCILNAFFELEK